MHRDDEAVRLLEADVRAHPDAAGPRRLLVRLRAAAGDLAGAKREAEELAKRLPAGDPTPFVEIGHAYELAHAYEEALASYDRAAEIAPTSPVGPREGGLRAARWGEVDVARPRLEEAIRRGASDPDVLHALGLVCLHAEDFEAANAVYRRCLGAESTGVRCALGLASVGLASKDGRLALEGYDEAIRRSPAFPAAHLGRAYALLLLDRKGEARASIRRAESLGAPKANVDKLDRAAREGL